MTLKNIGKKTAMRIRLSSFVAIVLLAACSQAVTKILPQEPTGETACALDGMLLLDYPGPKAQTHFAEGKPEFYCDVLDMFRIMLSSEQKRPVSAMFVQDMGKTSWEHPAGNWIDAKNAIYVAGSRKLGSMGATFGTFSSMQDAEAFMKKEGGKIMHFEQITLETVNLRAAH